MIRNIKNIKSNSDLDLLSLYVESGDLEVLGKLYTNYIHLVYGVCLKYLNNREESKDAVNRIFEKLITEIPKFEIKNFKAWLYVLTKNFCLMEIRKKKSEQVNFDKFSSDCFMESTKILHPIDEDRDCNLEKKLKDCIDKLKEEQRKCIDLFYYQSKCYREIAKDLLLNEKKVKSYIQNGKRNLKNCLE